MRRFLFASVIVVALLCIAGIQSNVVRSYLASQFSFLTGVLPLDALRASNAQSYDERFLTVSTASKSGEPDTIAYLAEGKAPLIVSLHEWSGTWQQYDPIAPHVADLEFHYIHPNFQGVNHQPDACLSDLVVSDIEKAIAWASDNADVDPENIIVTGLSGGGYTALGFRQLTTQKIKHTFAWVPMTDLDRWYFESKEKQNKYAEDVLGCIGGQYDQRLLQARSPLHIEENSNGSVSLFAGINDGHEGSVPISHSIQYFNKLANADHQILPENVARLLNREDNEIVGVAGGRDVYLDRSVNGARLVIFEGGHEMLPALALKELNSIVGQ